MRIAMVADVTPSSTSLISSSRVWLPSPQGTSSGSTALRNLKSLVVPWTVLATYFIFGHRFQHIKSQHSVQPQKHLEKGLDHMVRGTRGGAGGRGEGGGRGGGGGGW